MSDDFPIGVKHDERAERETRDAFLQRANAVGQRLWQHRNRVAGEIHAGRARASFDIKRRILRHKVRDIGDVHAEFVVACDGVVRDRNRVVEVLRVRRIDSENKLRSEIFAVRP